MLGLSASQDAVTLYRRLAAALDWPRWLWWVLTSKPPGAAALSRRSLEARVRQYTGLDVDLLIGSSC